MNSASALARHDIVPVHADYRTLPIHEGFHWPGIIQTIERDRELPNDQLYLVVFRSVRRYLGNPLARAELDAQVVAADTAAHEEALQSDALLHYFAGDLDTRRRAMSWCLWTGRAAARVALSGPAHQDAVGHTKWFYYSFSVEFFDVEVLRSPLVVQPIVSFRELAPHPRH